VTDSNSELIDLASLWCDDRLNAAQQEQLEEILRADESALDLFVEYVQLHGQLHWEGGGHVSPVQLGQQSLAVERPVLASADDPRQSSRRRPATAVAAVAMTVAALLLLAIVWRPGQQDDSGLVAGTDPVGPSASDNPDESAFPSEGVSDDLPPLRLDNLQNSVAENSDPADGSSSAISESDNVDARPSESRFTDEAIIARINALLRESWQENEVVPADYASDEEWVRRASLAFTGRIPTLSQAEEFINLKSPRKRNQLLHDLLDNEQLAESLAVNWTNLLVGRSANRGIDADALYAFLEEQFSQNVPWIDTVGRLLAAEGRSDEVGETNFLLAHLNNQATPATAVVSRLFLCEQVHCMQCHDHPTARDREQEEFWELNAFFKQASRKRVSVAMADGGEKRVWDLGEAERGGMTFFENRRGQQFSVLPEFDGQKLTAAPTERRRQSLVQFLENDSRQRVARAMVNRMWAHFFGAGFTNPIDDMGPHNPPTHPELLDTLTEAFVASDYNLRRLMRWIASTDAWQRSSWPPIADPDLDPLKGGTPVFSQVYPRHMTPEEVYESIRIAIRSIGRQPMGSSVGSQHRRQWVGQFVQALENDENEEALYFEGDVSQALLMMNGLETEKALPPTIKSMLAAEDGPGMAAGEALRQISMATIARPPTEQEDRVFRNRYRNLNRTLSREESLAIALEDMLWGYLNCSEFVTVQ
jgi:hypothetical protein